MIMHLLGELLPISIFCKRTHYYNNKSNVFTRDTNGDERIITYRERFSKEQIEISIKKSIADDEKTLFSYEDISTSNFYELIFKSSLAEKLFGTYPHVYVALTKEALELPIDEQPWFFGEISVNEQRVLEAGTRLEYLNENIYSFIQMRQITCRFLRFATIRANFG